MPVPPDDGAAAPGHGGGRPHVAFFTAAAHSHITPLLGTVAELVRRGVRVSYATTERFAPMVEAAGAEAVTFRSSLPADPADWPTDTRRLPLLYLADARATLPELEDRFAGRPPDLVVTEDPAGAGAVLAAKRGVPSMQVWTYLATPRHWSRTDPHVPGANPFAGEFLTGLAGFLRDEGVPTDVREHLDAAFSGGLVLVPRSFQPDAQSYGDAYTFAGPALPPEPEPGGWTPPPGDVPVALVTLGSIDHAHPEFHAMAAEAFAGLDWHLVMAVGERTDPALLGPLPPNVEAHRWVPQRAVLARASLVVHHGGMATTMESLHHGVPSLVVPRLPEQAANARRLRELGLGVALPLRSVTADVLRRAVTGLHAHEGVRSRVRAVRDEIVRAGHAGAAADAVERRLLRA
ncbi:macrolide family glycosyltransferase [Streptomyces sp. NPDC029216]|uniref:macrolide family glycosyltransferase n=1 Tax=Streptomyces sp. NPDC029216 TaxID=3154701 RepID=UPI003400E556